MGPEDADFSGWATKANLKCSDGRTIMPGAFGHQDNTKVPLVWQHAHNEPANVLGHAILEERPGEGVYCHGFFNSSSAGQTAKNLVQHGDIESLSIYANQLRENNLRVQHGMIREVSLVIAGANSGARIETVNLKHSDGSYEEIPEEAVIYTGTLEHINTDGVDDEDEDDEDLESEEEGDVEVSHADDSTVQEILATFNEEQQNVLTYLIGVALDQANGGASAQHADTSIASDDIPGVWHSFTEKQQDTVKFLIGAAVAEASDQAEHSDSDDNTAAHADNKEGNSMTSNLFERNAGTSATGQAPVLSHSDMASIFENAKDMGSLKKAVNSYADSHLTHGIQDIDTLFPDAKAVTSTPEFLARRTEWVNEVMSGTKHTPFAKIKSLTANLTLTEARAKGYVKGAYKEEEFFRVSKRTTEPQTVYKKQALDRDDIIDITDFDIVAWLKAEMRLMLEEEIARAVLVGDGRSAGDEDKIREDKVRPIASDSDLYVTYLYVNLLDSSSSAEEIIDAVTFQRRHYRGSGNPTLFLGEGTLAKLLLIKDTLGRRIYPTVQDLAVAMRVTKITAAEVLDEPGQTTVAILVNLQDYVIGADRGGDVALFDDFDIDYNKMKYLIETRISGALVKPKAALVVKQTAAGDTAVVAQSPTWNDTNHTVTVATTTGITYKNKATGATLTTGSPVTLAPGEELTVIAIPASGKYISSSAEDEFTYSYANGPIGGPF